MPPLPSLRDWTRHESQLGNPTLEAEVERTGDAELQQVLDWSLAVNAAVTELVHGLPPFPGVAETFEAGAGHADMIVVSATPLQTLQREWQEIQLDHYLQMIAGQEQGSKTEHLEYAARGKYDPDKILMIGDAPGDLKAASANGALFFPVVPGREEQSWANLASEGIDRFFNGRFAGAYQQILLAEFDEALPENPPWQGSG